MKTSEFKKKIEELGLKAYFASTMCVSVRADLGGALCVLIGSNDDYISFGEHLGCLEKELRDELVITCLDYAFTPVEERKDEKRYYWKIKNENYEHVKIRYLNVHEPSSLWHIGTKGNYGDTYKTQLTEREYKKMVEDDFIPDIFGKEEI